MSRSHVVLTGATGFVGKVVLAQLARHAEELGIGQITLIVRAKKKSGGAEARLARIFSTPLFREMPAQAHDGIRAVKGDLEHPRCGLSDDDFDAITSSATHIIHCAASVEFDLPVTEAASANITTALEALELARRCSGLAAMVAVSTAYVSPWRPGPILEELAHLPSSADGLYASILAGTCNEAALLAQSGHPNTYTLTKCIGEHLLDQRKGSVPLAIVRPSIVSASWRDPFPGWLDSPAALAGCLLYAGLGLVRAWRANPGVRLDVVPVDAVASAIVETAFTPIAKTGPVPIRHATMGIARALRIDRTVDETIRFFRERPGVTRKPDLFVGRKQHGFAAADLIRRELPTMMMRALFAATSRGRQKRRVEKVDEQVRYLNSAFEYFTHHTFDFRAQKPLHADLLEDFDPTEYIATVNRGLYRHLLCRDETALPFVGAAHEDGRNRLGWVTERKGNLTMRAFGLALREGMARCASNVTFDRPSFEAAVRQAPADALFVLAPSHRSYLDFLLSTFLFFQHPELGVPMPAIAAAEEFGNIPVVGNLLRASGAFYIRRGVGRQAPELNLELKRLAQRNASIMFFIEGQRSRGRQFLAPKRGLLRGLQATGKTFAVLPVAISYDRVPEEKSLGHELGGAAKAKMTLSGLVGWLGDLMRNRVKLGRIHLACGSPMVLDPTTDVHGLGRAILAEHQRHTTVSTFHLRCFLAEKGFAEANASTAAGAAASAATTGVAEAATTADHRPVLTEAWLAEAITARGGRVFESDLAVPTPLDPMLAASLRNQWMHWFYADALGRHPTSAGLRAHVEQNGWGAPGLMTGDSDERTGRLVDELFGHMVSATPALSPSGVALMEGSHAGVDRSKFA